MSVAVEGDASAVRKEGFSFNLDANSSADDIDRLRSRTRSIIPLWEKGREASSSRTTSSSSYVSTLDKSLSLVR